MFNSIHVQRHTNVSKQGSHTFFNFKFKDFSRLNKWFSRSHQCKIPGLFQVKLMFFVARKPKLIRIMHLHIATTCKLLLSALYISACFFPIFKSSSVFTHVWRYGRKHVPAYSALQIVWTQIRQDKMLGLIWIQIVWHWLHMSYKCEAYNHTLISFFSPKPWLADLLVLAPLCTISTKSSNRMFSSGDRFVLYPTHAGLIFTISGRSVTHTAGHF